MCKICFDVLFDHSTAECVLCKHVVMVTVSNSNNSSRNTLPSQYYEILYVPTMVKMSDKRFNGMYKYRNYHLIT
jgi:hypothetical protein